MDPTIVVAAITAVSSIAVAVIHASSSVTQARIAREQSSRAPQVSNQPAETPTISSAHEPRGPATKIPRQWWYVSIIVAMLGILLPSAQNDDDAAVLVLIVIIPSSVLLLSLLWPITWMYVAAFVTVLDAAALVGSILEYPDFTFGETEIRVLMVAYIGSIIVCTGVAYVRGRFVSSGLRVGAPPA